jgi:hypothetical protein
MTERHDLDLADLWASDQTRRIDIARDVWVEIKDELDHGEEQAMQAAAMKGITRQQLQSAVDEADTQDVILMDTARLHFLKLAFYVIDWNLKDQQGRMVTLPSKVEDRVKLFKRLKPSIGTKISEAIDALREEKAKEQIDPNDPPATPTTSPSQTAILETVREPSANGDETPIGQTLS